MKQVMCAHLRSFPIDRLLRRHKELRHRPVAIIETSANRQMMMAVSDEVPEGVRAGMTLAQARAHCSEIVAIDAEPEKDRHGLMALGYWMMRFSPNVAIDAASVYCASIFLDVSGMELLFGDVGKIAARVELALRRVGFSASVAVAPTPAAAWGLAVFEGKSIDIVDSDDLLPAISGLPVEALQLEAETSAALRKLGIFSVGHLLRIPREQLVARFGHGILQRMDEATGAMHQQMNWLPHRSKIQAEIEFDGVIESLETLHVAFEKALDRVVELLVNRGLGVKHLRMILRRPYASAIEKEIRLMRASRVVRGLFVLMRHTLEAVQTDVGFLGVGLVVVSAEKLGAEQAALVDDEGINQTAEVDHLIDRLRAKFGDVAEWAETRESYVPERAFAFKSDECPHPSPLPAYRAREKDMKCPTLSRPLSLLARPRMVRVIVLPSESRDGQPVAFTDEGVMHRLESVRGPERIAGQWWNLSNKTRDYFDVTDSEGNRFWVFRVMETNQWYLHGIFE